jgi:hypothetical protein
MVTCTRVISGWGGSTVEVASFKPMVTDTKASGKKECDTDKESSIGQITMSMRATGGTTEGLAMAVRFMVMATSIRARGLAVFGMETVYKTGLTVINTRENGYKIGGQALAHRCGLVNSLILATGRMTS